MYVECHYVYYIILCLSSAIMSYIILCMSSAIMSIISYCVCPVPLCLIILYCVCPVPSRRGDLEITGYCMLEWLCQQLPWEDNLNNKEYVRDSKIKYVLYIVWKWIYHTFWVCAPYWFYLDLNKFSCLQYCRHNSKYFPWYCIKVIHLI